MQVGTLTTPNTGLVGRTELYKGKDFRNYEVPDYIPEIEMRFPINYNVAPNSLIDVLKKEQMIYNSSFQGPMTRALLENGRQDVLEKIYEENDKEDVDKDENFNLEEGAEVTPRALRRIIYNNDYLIPTLKRADPQLYNNKTLGNNVGEYFDLDYNRGSGILSCKKGGSVAAALGIGALAAAAWPHLKKGYQWTKNKAIVTGTKLRDKALDSYLYIKSRPEQARRNRTIKKDIKNINKVGTIKSIKDWWNDHRAQSKRNNMDRIENMAKINAIMKPTIVSEDYVRQPFVEKYLAPVYERDGKLKPDLNPDFNEEKAKELYGLLEQREKDMKSIKKKPKLFRTKKEKAMLNMYNEQNQRYGISPALTGEIDEMYKDNSGKMLVRHRGREMKKDFDELLNRQNNSDEDVYENNLKIGELKKKSKEKYLDNETRAILEKKYPGKNFSTTDEEYNSIYESLESDLGNRSNIYHYNPFDQKEAPHSLEPTDSRFIDSEEGKKLRKKIRTMGMSNEDYKRLYEQYFTDNDIDNLIAKQDPYHQKEAHKFAINNRGNEYGRTDINNPDSNVWSLSGFQNNRYSLYGTSNAEEKKKQEENSNILNNNMYKRYTEFKRPMQPDFDVDLPEPPPDPNDTYWNRFMSLFRPKRVKESESPVPPTPPLSNDIEMTEEAPPSKDAGMTEEAPLSNDVEMTEEAPPPSNKKRGFLSFLGWGRNTEPADNPELPPSTTETTPPPSTPAPAPVIESMDNIDENLQNQTADDDNMEEGTIDDDYESMDETEETTPAAESKPENTSQAPSTEDLKNMDPKEVAETITNISLDEQIKLLNDIDAGDMSVEAMDSLLSSLKYEPVNNPIPTNETAPAPKPQPQPTPAPKPQPQPAPAPESQPQPAPAPKPQPQPAPAPESHPQPAPAPKPQPQPAPAPDSKKKKKPRRARG